MRQALLAQPSQLGHRAKEPAGSMCLNSAGELLSLAGRETRLGQRLNSLACAYTALTTPVTPKSHFGFVLPRTGFSYLALCVFSSRVPHVVIRRRQLKAQTRWCPSCTANESHGLELADNHHGQAMARVASGRAVALEASPRRGGLRRGRGGGDLAAVMETRWW